MHHFTDVALNDRLTRNHFEIFGPGPDLKHLNVGAYVSLGSPPLNLFKYRSTDRLFSHEFLKAAQCLPRYRYTADGERVSNITEWGLGQLPGALRRRVHHRRGRIRLHLRRPPRPGVPREVRRRPAAGVPAPALPRRLLMVGGVRPRAAGPAYQLRVGGAVWPLERVEKDGPSTSSGPAVKAVLRADREQWHHSPGQQHHPDRQSQTEAWEYRLGSRSALEWVLDQYRERTPRDPDHPPSGSTPTASPTTRSGSSTCCSGSAPSASAPWPSSTGWAHSQWAKAVR